jgi:hypothetical protein
VTVVLFLLALQDQQPVVVEEAKPERADVEFAAVRQIWWPRFRGSRRGDGGGLEGSRLRFDDDLNLPNDATIPMYGGGDICLSVHQSLSKNTLLLFSAEYWTHEWAGGTTLAGPETFKGDLFSAGTPVQSRLHLMSLLLDAFVVHEEAPFTVGASIPLQFLSSRFRLDTAGEDGKQTIRDVCWGGGVFIKARPVHWLYGGVSAKGLTSFASAGDTAIGDFKGFGGVQWGPVTLEGGYRWGAAHLWRPDEELEYVLYGAYASLTFTLRF